MTSLIGLTARKGVGKSTLAALLRERIPGSEIIAFADALRDEVDAAIQRSGSYTPRSWLEEHKATVYGPLLQGWGEFKRLRYGEDYWIARLDDEARGAWGPVIIPDVRYLNEVAYIKGQSGLLVAIHGPSRWTDDARSETHPSEAEVEACQARADIAVHNDGSLEDLGLWADFIVKELTSRGK